MNTPQKVVIPKGLVGAGETAVVEIPPQLKNVSTVVARPKANSAYECSLTPPLAWGELNPDPRKRNIKPFRTWPKKRPKDYALYEEGGYSFGGYPNDESESEVHFTTQRPRPLWYRSPREISPGPVQYPEGLHRRIGDFYPNACLSSTMRDIDDPPEMTLYKDFHPKDWSPNEDVEPYSPMSMSRWDPSFEGFYSPDIPHRIRAHGFEDKGDQYLTNPAPPTFKFWGDNKDGSPEASPQSHVEEIVEDLETRELQKFMANLRKFQTCRRKLVIDTAYLAAASDVYNE